MSQKKVNRQSSEVRNAKKPPKAAKKATSERSRRLAFEQDAQFPFTEPVFETERLWVISHKIRMPEGMPRTLFLGLEKDCEFPRVVICATVWLNGPYLGDQLDWMEVVASEQRVGFGTEFWLGLKEHLGGELHATPVTESGKAFAQSLPERCPPHQNPCAF